MTATLETAPRSPEDPEKKDKKRGLGKKIGVFVAGVALATGIGAGAKAMFDHDKGPDAPSTSAPANPGETSTTHEIPSTAETVKLTVDGVETVGIGGENGFIAKYGVFLDNDPKLPALTMEQGTALWGKYLGALQAGVNVEASPADKALKAQAVDDLLFVPGATGALPSAVDKWQEDDSKIVGIEKFGLLGQPEKAYPAQGTAIVHVKGSDGVVKRYNITAALTNYSGSIRNVDTTSTVTEITQ